MSAYRTYHNIFFAWNGPGPYDCAWCGEKVYPWWDTQLNENADHTLDVHHVDHDRTNNDHRNLAPMHHGCHMEYHRKIRPLVAKGSQLPDEWRQRIARITQERLLTQGGDEYARWLQRTRDGISAIDRTPAYCDECGDGPFQGTHGVAMHRRKSGHAEGRISQALQKKQAEAQLQALYCECGDGPYYSERALWTHRGWHKSKPSTGDSPALIYCPDCGNGPYRSIRSVSIHKGMKKCVSSTAMV
jgi:hypothetical protein